MSRKDNPPQEPGRRVRLFFVVAATAVALVGGAVILALSMSDGGDAQDTLSEEARDNSSEGATSIAPTDDPSIPYRGGGNNEFSNFTTSCLRNAETRQDQRDCLRFRPVRAVILLKEASDTAATTAPVTVTPREEDVAEAEVVLPGLNEAGGEPALYVLGPAGALGSDISDAQAVFVQTQWSVRLTFTSEGLARFNEIAASCFNAQPTCAQGAVAVVVDGTVVSAPTVQEAQFSASDDISITGDFTEREARELAAALSS